MHGIFLNALLVFKTKLLTGTNINDMIHPIHPSNKKFVNMIHEIHMITSHCDMSDQNPVDPSKMIAGRRAMTQSHRKESESGHIPKRGRGRRVDGSGSSQEASRATQPEESQVVDPSQQVEYLNYQDQVHHDVTDGGYDQDHILEEQHIADDDDIAAAAALEVLPVDPPFPRGPEDLSLLHSYVKHPSIPYTLHHKQEHSDFSNFPFYFLFFLDF
ncbi:hypothetical protein MtrunA17_Chr3g0137281 [Medicago truncatula]|uniref:Uncharacterized protein n=1 Tax=Medicago truncatula TaxID=3880 RepID=A0A396IY06_MEDTR|nr:hypothetical protein MtrunA17_Chr3g0137281 [Medicago truncatula]